MKTTNFFTVLIVFQIFFSVGINIWQEITPTDSKTVVSNLLGVDIISLNVIQTKLEDGLSDQTNMPVVDLAALAFYSGNLLLDLLLNFAFAIPQCATIIFEGLALMFNLNSTMMVQFQAYIFVMFLSLYFIGIIGMLSNMRTGVIQ